MMVLITYDVNTSTPEGQRRLRKVAKHCINYGQRVQKSVFECLLDPAQYTYLKRTLEKEIDCSQDNIRFYLLGNNWKRRVEEIGTKDSYDPEGFFMV